MIITAEMISTLTRRVNIVELVRETVPLELVGANYTGMCPFHVDDKPTFVVNPKSGQSVCHHCGGGGDAISYTAQLRNMSITESVRFLLSQYQIHQ